MKKSIIIVLFVLIIGLIFLHIKGYTNSNKSQELFKITNEGVITVNDKFKYSLINNNPKTWSVENVIIPSEINGIKVKKIDSMMFWSNKTDEEVFGVKGNENIKTIVIPEGVEVIGYSAFQNCKNLTNISFPSTIKDIGENAFKNTSWYDLQSESLIYICDILYKCKSESLSNNVIQIKEGTKKILNYAFLNCKNVVSIIIPDSVEQIGIGAFYDCTQLENIDIPESVTKINSNTFYGCVNLEKIDLDDRIQRIDSTAFTNTKWYELQPDGIIYVNNILFKYKGELSKNTTIQIKEGTKVIEDEAFLEMKNISQVILPNSLEVIGFKAFRGCIGLKNVEIPSNTSIIETSAFELCDNLENVYIPQTVTYIGNDAFYGANKLNLSVERGTQLNRDSENFSWGIAPSQVIWKK